MPKIGKLELKQLFAALAEWYGLEAKLRFKDLNGQDAFKRQLFEYDLVLAEGGSNIAEDWRRRRYISFFRNKVTDAMQGASERQCWLEFACACRYITDDVFQNLDAEYEGIIKILSNMEMKSEKFCYVERGNVKGRKKEGKKVRS